MVRTIGGIATAVIIRVTGLAYLGRHEASARTGNAREQNIINAATLHSLGALSPKNGEVRLFADREGRLSLDSTDHGWTLELAIGMGLTIGFISGVITLLLLG
jgi:hypothetical protein